MKKVVIIGASGHGKVIADIIKKSGDTVQGYLDDDESLGDEFYGYPLFGKVECFADMRGSAFVIAIGNGAIRRRITGMMGNVDWYTAIHPSAVIADGTSIGEGTVIMAGAVIGPDVRIGRHCIINTSSVVEHDNEIEDFVHISVGTKLAGTVHVGEGSWIGIGAVVSNNLSICADCMVGAGAVVIKDIDSPGTYVGVPAAKL